MAQASTGPIPSAFDGSMLAVVTTGVGGNDRLELRQVPISSPGPGEVLLAVLAAGVNNTDISRRIDWYAGSVTGVTDPTLADPGRRDGAWTGTTPFPLIQGAGCCGRLVSVGPGVDPGRAGARVLVR